MCSVSHSERQGSSSCDLNVDRPALLLCRVISMSRAVNLAPQEPSRAEAGGLRASRVRDLATALSLVALGSTAEARGTACCARGRRLWVPWWCVCVSSTPHMGRGG